MLALEIPDLGLLPSQHYLQTTHEGHGYRSPYTAICHLSMLFNESLNNLASWTEGSQTEGRTDGRTDRFPLCSTGLRPLRGRCPAPPQHKSHTAQAGHGYR